MNQDEIQKRAIAFCEECTQSYNRFMAQSDKLETGDPAKVVFFDLAKKSLEQAKGVQEFVHESLGIDMGINEETDKI